MLRRLRRCLHFGNMGDKVVACVAADAVAVTVGDHFGVAVLSVRLSLVRRLAAGLAATSPAATRKLAARRARSDARIGVSLA